MTSNYTLFVDESGDHGLDSIDPNYPVFVLCGVLVRRPIYLDEICPAFREVKERYWGHDGVVFHESDIRKPRGDFSILQRRQVRDAFMGDLHSLMGRLQYTLIYSVIKKEAYRARYSVPANPYQVAMGFLLERAFLELNSRGLSKDLTRVVVESRGKREDRELHEAFDAINAGRNACGRGFSFELHIIPKTDNCIGLQLADLAARPMGRKTLKPDQANRAFDVIADKVRRSPSGQIEGWGIKTFP